MSFYFSVELLGRNQFPVLNPDGKSYSLLLLKEGEYLREWFDAASEFCWSLPDIGFRSVAVQDVQDGSLIVTEPVAEPASQVEIWADTQNLVHRQAEDLFVNDVRMFPASYEQASVTLTVKGPNGVVYEVPFSVKLFVSND